MAFERQHLLGLERSAGGVGAREVAEALLSDRERDREPGRAVLARERLDDVDGAHDRGRVVADAGPDDAITVEPRLVRHGTAEDGVQVREHEHARAHAVEAPDQVAGGVHGALTRRIGEALLQPGDAVALVERRGGHGREADQVVECIVRGAHAARRYQAAMRADRPAAVRARKDAAASIAASTLKPSSRAWAISITCSTESAS